MSEPYSPGAVLDERYRVERYLGRGGMGDVLLVHHLHLHRLRVVKVLRRDLLEDAAARERFLSEARLATRIQHRNVATLHDCSLLPDGSSYMVWEYIEGETLKARLERDGRLPVAEVVEIGVQALRGLAAIHAAGVVHQDLSPDNLMLTQDGEGRPVVKIIDLGVALAHHGESGLAPAEAFAGKLLYCSPEQAQSDPERPPDHRSDLYSLALVLYEALSETLPFEAETVQGLFLRRLHQDPVPISQRLDGEALPEALEAALMKALERHPERRFANAVAFIQALTEVPGGRGEAPAATAGTEESRLEAALQLFEQHLAAGRTRLARLALDTVDELAPGDSRRIELRRKLEEAEQLAPDRERLVFLFESGRQALARRDLNQAERWLDMLRETGPRSEERRLLEAEVERAQGEDQKRQELERSRRRLESALEDGRLADAERALDAVSSFDLTKVTMQGYRDRLETLRESQQEAERAASARQRYTSAVEARDWTAARRAVHELEEIGGDLGTELDEMLQAVERQELADRKRRAVMQGLERLEEFLAAGDLEAAETAYRALRGIESDFPRRVQLEARLEALRDRLGR